MTENETGRCITGLWLTNAHPGESDRYRSAMSPRGLGAVSVLVCGHGFADIRKDLLIQPHLRPEIRIFFIHALQGLPDAGIATGEHLDQLFPPTGQLLHVFIVWRDGFNSPI